NRRSLRVAAALGAAGLGLLTGFAAPVGAQARTVAKAVTVQLQVISVTPTSPVISHTPKPLTVRLEVTNRTGNPLSKLTIGAVRGDPIASQRELDKSLAAAPWPDNGLVIPATHPVRLTLAAHASATVDFRTDTDVPQDAGICLCHQAIYPLFFGVYRGSDSVRLASAHTYLPVFSSAPAPVRVSWVWPLIDRPHRSTSETVFTDDTLTDLVSSGGRLDKSLTVLERVAARKVPVTLLIDPDLLDELAVMAAGRYTVQSARSAPRATGSGSAVAAAWLGRLQTLLTNHTNVQVQLTPYADPDVQSLSDRHLTWAPRLAGPTMTSRVQAALAGRPLAFDTAWPAAGALTPATLGTLEKRDGVRTVLLDATGVSQPTESSLPPGLARLKSNRRVVAAGLLTGALQRDAAALLTNANGTGLAALPQLAAEIAVQAAQQPDVEHEVVLAAPRYVDPDPDTAYRTIMDTTHAPYIAATSLTALTATNRLPAATGRLRPVPADRSALPAAIIDEVNESTTALPTVNSLLGTDPTARATLLVGLPRGVQRSTSSAWRTQRAAGALRADQLTDTFQALIAGVHIVRPTSGSYTLGSSNSTLPITVQNDLPYLVRVKLVVTTVNNVPGFNYTDIGVQTIQPRTKRTLHLSTEISRTGRIGIEAQLYTPNDQQVGQAVDLSVHSTALGVVGVVITVVAGAVLVIALFVRFTRRFRKRERPTARAQVPVGTGPVR
ncbi:MAG TPA: hypothetical protein VFU35_06555, partial [Jatrophihabitans sp.]|nr:hypothetical protein [Jatrophihabitans sp.]